MNWLVKFVLGDGGRSDPSFSRAEVPAPHGLDHTSLVIATRFPPC